MNKKNGVNKITRTELDELQNLVKTVNNIKLDIADQELRKHNLLKVMDAYNEKYVKMQENLKEKYGDVDVSVKDGSITPRSEAKLEKVESY